MWSTLNVVDEPSPTDVEYSVAFILASIEAFDTAIVGVAPSPELLVNVTLAPATKLAT